MTLQQEKELLDKIAKDSKHFGSLFDYYYKPIFRYAFRRTGDYNVARDVSAETFLKAYLKIHTFRWKGISISSWLYKVASNEVNQFFRKEKYTAQTFQRAFDDELISKLRNHIPEDEKTRLEEEMMDHERFLQIQQKMKLLDVKYQEVIALRYFENKENKEISEILEKPEGTVKSLLSRGLEKLRNLMK